MSSTKAHDPFVFVFDPISEPGTLELTVTGQNLQPYFGEIFASSPDGAYVAVNEVNLKQLYVKFKCRPQTDI